MLIETQTMTQQLPDHPDSQHSCSEPFKYLLKSILFKLMYFLYLHIFYHPVNYMQLLIL